MGDFKSLQCHLCGGPLIAKENESLATCAHCKAAFMVDWPEQPKDTNVLEKWLKDAATFLTVGEPNMAEALYLKVIEEYPGDSRGWWGMLKNLMLAYQRADVLSMGEMWEDIEPYYRKAMVVAGNRKAEHAQEFYNLCMGVFSRSAVFSVVFYGYFKHFSGENPQLDAFVAHQLEIGKKQGSILAMQYFVNNSERVLKQLQSRQFVDQAYYKAAITWALNYAVECATNQFITQVRVEDFIQNGKKRYRT